MNTILYIWMWLMSWFFAHPIILSIFLPIYLTIYLSMQVCRADSVWRVCDLSYQLLYDVFSLLVTLAWLAVGTHTVADLHLRKNYATHNPNQDVGYISDYLFIYLSI